MVNNVKMATSRSVDFESENPHNFSDTDLLIERGYSRSDSVSLNDAVSVQRPRRRNITYEDAIRHAGLGWFQSKLLLLCGWALLSNAAEVLNVSFVLPTAVCEMHLNREEQTLFTLIIYFGMLVGGLLLADLGDWFGRRPVLIFSLIVSAVFGLATSLAQTSSQFLAFRFFSGIGIGGSVPVIFAYFGEFQPKIHRGMMISCLATFWVIGGILVSGMAWLMLLYKFGIDNKDFIFSGWHIFLSLCVVPSLMSAVLIFLMPESPKFLMESGRKEEAYQVFQNIFAENHRELLPSEFEHRVNRLVWSIDHMNMINNSIKIVPKCDGIVKLMWKALTEIFRSWTRLFSGSLRRSTLLMSVLFILIAFGAYGFNTWFREIFLRFQRMEKTGGTVCHPFNYTESSTTDEPCYPSEHFFRNKFLVNVFCLPGCLLTILLVEKVGRKALLAGGLILSGTVVFFVWLLSRDTEVLVVDCIISGLGIISWTTLDVLAVEVFPTELRCTAFGVLTGIGSVATVSGILAFNQLVYMTCLVPMLLIVVLFYGSGFLGCLLPNTCQSDLT